MLGLNKKAVAGSASQGRSAGMRRTRPQKLRVVTVNARWSKLSESLGEGTPTSAPAAPAPVPTSAPAPMPAPVAAAPAPLPTAVPTPMPSLQSVTAPRPVLKKTFGAASALESLVEESKKQLLQLNDVKNKLVEELESAHKINRKLELRVIELEEQLELRDRMELRAAAAAASANPITAASLSAPAMPVAAPPPMPMVVQHAAPQAVSMPPAPAAPKPAAPAASKTITLTYTSGWDTVYCHYNLNNKGWTIAPGRKMTKQGNGVHSITVEGAAMEFVLTNGGNDWDTPNPFGNHGQPSNYVVKSPGSYRLKSGKVEKA